MLRKTFLTAGAAIALASAISMPASARGGGRDTSAEPVPEPMTILGSIAVGGGLLAKKFKDSRQEEQK
ncbi:PEP-CTERM sorting domain-containing protein [Oscillatoria sp. CS-180]|uniref:PEP-CTERM sorting domain-containing protein n=1 Tax=Oscillatoria sp. CS-180 TaxID=3021720 RepID=UPI00232DB557|nr:PEP-CTERM sorting domain-containing protein [Oscillatoria sp. CS-180]MDB9527238.1 PEP-CTERM sorting domain-containing protein [Oscillatoria sp. CS-180]